MSESDVMEIDLLQLVKALWKRLWLVMLAAVICGAVGFFGAYFLITPLYKADTLLYVNNCSVSAKNAENSVKSEELTAAQSLVDTYIVILKSRTVLNEVIEEADVPYTDRQLSEMLTASSVNSTEFFSVTVTSKDPYESENIANAVAVVLPEQISNVVEGSEVRIVDYAVVPGGKSSPGLTHYAALGCLAGVILCSGIIVLYELFNDQVKSEDYLLQSYDIPLLAVIPNINPNHQKAGAYSEAPAYYRRSEESIKGETKRADNEKEKAETGIPESYL